MEENPRLDHLIRCMNVNPDYIEEKKREMVAWREEVLVCFGNWYKEMKKIVPPTVNKNSVEQLEGMGMSKNLAERFTKKKCLWLIRMDRDYIRKIHISDLRNKYSCDSAQKLDIVELAAIYMSLPDKFNSDQQQSFRSDIEIKLKKMYSDFKSKKLLDSEVRNPVYKNVDTSRFGFDDNTTISIGDDNVAAVMLFELAV